VFYCIVLCDTITAIYFPVCYIPCTLHMHDIFQDVCAFLRSYNSDFSSSLFYVPHIIYIQRAIHNFRYFFPKRLSNHLQGLRRACSEICTKCYALPLYDLSRNRIGPDTRLQIKGRNKNQQITKLSKMLYTVSQDMRELSSAVIFSYYNCCTDVSNSPGNYGYP
jgi:hypothetical protein